LLPSDTSGSLSRGKNIGGITDGPSILFLEYRKEIREVALSEKQRKAFGHFAL
jgi:hypothetical protein